MQRCSEVEKVKKTAEENRRDAGGDREREAREMGEGKGARTPVAPLGRLETRTDPAVSTGSTCPASLASARHT